MLITDFFPLAVICGFLSALSCSKRIIPSHVDSDGHQIVRKLEFAESQNVIDPSVLSSNALGITLAQNGSFEAFQIVNGNISVLPVELIQKIFAFLPRQYAAFAQVNKYYYVLSRPVQYNHMMHICLNCDIVTGDCFYNSFLNFRFPDFRNSIIQYMIKIARDNNRTWIKLLWFFNNQTAKDAFDVLNGRGPFEGKMNEQTVLSISKLVVETVDYLYDLSLMSAGSITEYANLVNGTITNNQSKLSCLAKLMLERDDVTAVKKVLSDSIDPSLWENINMLTNSMPISTIAQLHDGLVKQHGIMEQFAVALFDQISSDPDLMSANEIAYEEGLRNIENDLEYIADKSLLFDESFCKRHMFTMAHCVECLEEESFQNLLLMALERRVKDSTWQRELLKRLQLGERADRLRELKSADLQFAFHVFMGTIQEFADYEKVSKSFIAETVLKCHNYVELTDMEIEDLIIKTDASCLKNTNDLITVFKWINTDEDGSWLLHLMTDNQLYTLINEAIQRNDYKILKVMFKEQTSAVFNVILKHVDTFPEFDSASVSDHLHRLLILCTSSEKFRDKHIAKVSHATLVEDFNAFKGILNSAQIRMAKSTIKKIEDKIDLIGSSKHY